MSEEPMPIEELLTAYFDGELDLAQRQSVEALLAEQPQYAALLETWRSDRALLKRAPRFPISADFTARLQARISQVQSAENGQLMVDEASDLSPQLRVGSASTGLKESARDFKLGLSALASLAALLLVTLALSQPSQPSPAAVSLAELTSSENVEKESLDKGNVEKENITKENITKENITEENMSEESRMPVGPARSKITRAPLMMRPRGARAVLDTSQPVIAPADFGFDQPSGFSQVLLIKLSPSAPSPAVALASAWKAALANDAATIASASPQSPAAASSDNDRVAAFSVVLSASQLRRLQARLTQQSQATINTITPRQAASATAQALIPSPVSVADLDPRQAAERDAVNNWFGLIDDRSNNRAQETLLIFERSTAGN